MVRPWLSARTPAPAAGARLPARTLLPRRHLSVVCSSGVGEENRTLFIFGMGYTGIAVGNYFRHRGWDVVGTARDEDKVRALNAKGFRVYHFAPEDYELLGGRALDALARATHVLSTVPPSEEEAVEDPVLMAHMRNLGDGAQQYRWLGYVSSTSVYGNHEGNWVDEQSEVRATSGKGFVRLMAEHEWLHLYYNYQMPVHIFRCAGIYGPRRSALEAVRQQGLPSSSQQRRARQQYTSRVHVYDICQTIMASINRPNPGAVYNVVDDDPAGRLEVMEYAAQLLGLPIPAATPAATAVAAGSGSAVGGGAAVLRSGGSVDEPGGGGASSEEAEALLAAAAASARRGEKRVSNARIKRELGVRLAFPTYREGLTAIMQHDMRPFD